MSKCAVCRGDGVCTACKGNRGKPCSCWPRGQCPRCKGSGNEPQ